MLSESKKKAPTPNLFEVEVKEFSIPQLWNHELEEIFDELELLGFTVNTTPYSLIKEPPDLPLRAKDLPAHSEHEVHMLLYLINVKHTQTGKGAQMKFGTWYDADGAWVDTVHFPDSAISFPFTWSGLVHRQRQSDE
jgi:DNA polymerase-3 subunit alpha